MVRPNNQQPQQFGASVNNGDGGADLRYDKKKDRVDTPRRNKTYLGSMASLQASSPSSSSSSDSEDISFSDDFNFLGTHASSNTPAELATSEDSRSDEEIAEELLDLNSVDGGEEYEQEQAVQTPRLGLAQGHHPEYKIPESYPSNQKSSRLSRLSWAPEIAFTSSSETHASSNTPAELATSEDSRSDEEIAEEFLDLNSVDGGEEYEQEQAVQTPRLGLAQGHHPEYKIPESYPSNQKSSRLSRLSWAPEIAFTSSSETHASSNTPAELATSEDSRSDEEIAEELLDLNSVDGWEEDSLESSRLSCIELAKDCPESDSESEGGEGHPIIPKMKDGVADALVDSLIAVSSCEAIVLSVDDSNKYLYGVEWLEGGEKPSIELHPDQYGDRWTIIGKRSKRGRISRHNGIQDLGKAQATGRRQGSSTASKKTRPKRRVQSGRKSISTPAVVKQKRTRYKHTPKGLKRRNDLKLQSAHAIQGIAKEWFGSDCPAATRVRRVADALRPMNGVCDNALTSVMKTMSNVTKEAKPLERRQILSLWAESAGVTRERAEGMLGYQISPYEWEEAGKHFRFPGPLQPASVAKSSRQRFSTEELMNLLGYLDEYHIQRLAFGENSIETPHGNIIPIDAVESTSGPSVVARDYANYVNPAGKTCGENQCKKRHPATRHYCLREHGHDGRCKFTPDNAISAESIRHILSKVTTGQQKSYQGLDDEMVYKGTRNVRRLLQIYDLLSITIGESEMDRQKMKERIGSMEDWHKAGFLFHLSRHGDRCCQCISCGLHSTEEPIDCHKRSSHGEPCSLCEDSFQVISDLKALAQKAQEREGRSRAEIEQMVELEAEIDTCRQLLYEYRAHIVQKKVEGMFYREQIQSLTASDAVVICDFKMKINPLYFREAQKDWYGKRGIACCGFLVYTKGPQEGEVYAEYFYFFSDDTCQDTNMVLAAKSYIYKEHLPTLFPEGTVIQVKWETDGAGCFNSNLMKACQPMWYVWTNSLVDEVQIRHSANGGGKTSLDGAFATLAANQKDIVNRGVMDIIDASSCLRAFHSDIGAMRNASAAILHVPRDHDIKIPDSSGEPALLHSHRIVLERDKNQVRCFRNSGYGEGVVISLSSHERMVPPTTQMPRYEITQDTGADDSNREPVTHSTESYYTRKGRKRRSRQAGKREKMDKEFRDNIAAAEKKGIHLCTCRRVDDLAPCKKQFLTKNALDRHIENGKHEYTGRNMTTKSAMLVSGRGGTLAVGQRMNRNEEHFSGDHVRDGVGKGIFHGTEWRDPGCYMKAGRNKPTQKSLRLITELVKFFKLGESDSSESKSRNKYTAERALTTLRDMKNPSGMRTFSSTSVYGPLPTIQQIKSFWSSYKRLQDDGELKNADDETLYELLSDDINNGEGGQIKLARFFLDGTFDDKQVVTDTIESMGGVVLDTYSKKTEFIVQGSNPRKKRKDTKDTVRYTNWDQLQLLQQGAIFMEDLAVNPIDTECSRKSTKRKMTASTSSRKTRSTSCGPLSKKKFFFDGYFEDITVIDNIKKKIVDSGGTVLQRCTKLTDFIVQGENSKHNDKSHVIFTSLDKVQRLLEGHITIEDFSVVSTTGLSQAKM